MSENKYMSAEELGVQNHICVLPCGEESESGLDKWTAKELLPYQYYTENGVTVDRMFRGLIFTPVNGRKGHYLNAVYSEFGEQAERKDWEKALRELFEENFNLDAAAKNTADGDSTDVWITLPYPVHTQGEFGTVKRKDLNFDEDRNRFTAIKWWMNKFLKKWERANHLHDKLTLRGFVWPRVSVNSGDKSLVKRVTNYIRRNGFLSLWLQQYGSSGCPDWKAFGFDASCTHPNFYGKGPDFPWIANSTVFAEYFHLGMQVTFGKGVLFEDNHLRDYLNYGVYNRYMNEALLVYQFPNQTMSEISSNHPTEYEHIHSFINGTYTPVYPSAAFPTHVS